MTEKNQAIVNQIEAITEECFNKQVFALKMGILGIIALFFVMIFPSYIHTKDYALSCVIALIGIPYLNWFKNKVLTNKKIDKLILLLEQANKQ